MKSKIAAGLPDINQLGIDLLDQAINRYLSLDPEMAKKIATFNGRVIAIEPVGLGRTFYLLPRIKDASDDGFICVAEHTEDEVDVTLRGTPLALFKMGLVSDVAPLMLKGEIEIDGDVSLGKKFKKILAGMDIDWEEKLANVIGDIPAYQASQLLSKLSHWSRRAKDSIASDLSEYLQEESRDVVSGAELEIFYSGVDRLRNDMDCLQLRFEALKTK